VIDCLIIGYNDGRFEREVQMMRSMGLDHPDYRDLRLNFIEHEGRPYRAMDILDHFHYEGRPDPGPRRKFHNTEVLWMVVMYLGTYLARRGFSFDYVNLFQLQKDELLEKLRTRKYLTAIVTTTIYNYDSPILEVVNFLREHSPETKVVVGGPYIAKRAESMTEPELQAVFKYIDADFYVRSREGEQALARLLAALKSDQDFAAIPNIAYRDGGRFALTPTEREYNALYENLIDYSLFPQEHVGGYVNVRITKGCPFTCSFCSFPLRTEKYDVSRLEYIERELNAIRDVGTVTGLFFVDDTANVPLATFKEMMRMMIRQNYGFRWHCFFRADFCDAELVDLMARAGCQGVFLGLESANDQMLINMHKTPRKHHYLSVVPMFKAAGIKVFASLFFGFPGETHATAQETLDFLAETRPDYYRPLVWYCDPVTPIWKERDRYGIKGYHFSWSHDTMDVGTACDLVERCFLTFDQPLWVPDPGFNFVSLFLLQNRGMSLDQVDEFLRCFNAVVRQQVLEPEREASPQLIENLRRACQYDRPARPDPEALEVFSADRYGAAERFLLDQFATGPAPAGGKGRTADAEEDWQPGPRLPLAGSQLGDLQRACGTQRSGVLLATLATVLLRLSGRDDTTLIAAVDGSEPLPLHLTATERQPFRELARAAQGKVEATLPHQRFARTVTSGVFRMPGYLKATPVFDVGYLEVPAAAGDEPWRFATPGYGDLELILRVEAREEGAVLQLFFSPAAWSAGRVEELGEALRDVLSLAAADPGVAVGDIPLAAPARPGRLSGRSLAALAAPQFNF
jgi:radical SAM PhpK family P-methyltransferase